MEPDVIPSDQITLKWEEPKAEELIEFMVKEKGFNEDRIKSGIERLRKGLKVGVQKRLDSFFKIQPKTKEELAAAAQKAKDAKKKAATKGKIGKRR